MRQAFGLCALGRGASMGRKRRGGDRHKRAHRTDGVSRARK